VIRLAKRYAHWLHTQWPAGTVERLPVVSEGGVTNVPGISIVGDLTGIPLLKFASRTGAQAARLLSSSEDPEAIDVAIIGGGVSGISAAIEAKRAGLRFEVFEASEPFFTIVNFPKGKPIFNYPSDLGFDGGLQIHSDLKETLLSEVEKQLSYAKIEVQRARVNRVESARGCVKIHFEDGSISRARHVIVAIGRSGEYRKIGCPGEDLHKVYNRLHDPKDYAGKEVLIVGGGDTAVESAIALAEAGARVTLSYRRREFVRVKEYNLAKLKTSKVRLLFETRVLRIESESVTLQGSQEITIANDVVFTMLGREAPLDFLRRSGIKIRGDWTPLSFASFLGFFVFCCFLYLWKGSTSLNQLFQHNRWFPYNLESMGSDPRTLLGVLAIDLGQPGFYYSIAYCAVMAGFGWRRIRRRQTPYVRAQTLTLIAFQLIPLFLLPYVLLPWMGYNGWFDSGWMRTAADQLFPPVNYDHGREYWRAFGFVLAWPLFIWNVFTVQPLWWWLAISFLQTFVLIPLILYRWGKGAYCGWICSCGGLAETLGDTHREKMPHGPSWNRLNMVGQAILLVVFALLGLRIVSWVWPASAAGAWFGGLLTSWSILGLQLNYYHFVDILLAGIVGLGFYFWFSGRVWCRFACPLAALMHIYTRFSKYRIFPDKKKCISCNVCTSVCHQGIDVMNFANKGLPMEDPQCVRCSACVQMCPTGVLTFGRYDRNGDIIYDRLPSSLVQIQESKRT
jgi:NosR/NirI family transcriptional regulator, nitrous oxide reductase regulator